MEFRVGSAPAQSASQLQHDPKYNIPLLHNQDTRRVLVNLCNKVFNHDV